MKKENTIKTIQKKVKAIVAKKKSAAAKKSAIKKIKRINKKFITAPIFERITDAFMALDKNWCFTYMNKKAGEIFNCIPEQMIGKHIWTEFAEGINQSFYQAYQQAMMEQKYMRLEEYYLPYDKWFENHVYPSPDGLTIYFRDISEKKLEEESLRMANQRLTKHLSNTPLAVIEWDKNLIVQKWSAAAEKIFGWNEIEVVGKHFDEFNLVYEEDAAAVGKIVNELMTAAVDQNKILNRNRTKDGKIIYCHWFNSVLKDESGSTTSIMSLIKDETENTIAQQQIIKESKLLNDIIDGIPGVFAIRDEHKLLRWNKQLEIISGYSAAELKSINPIDTFYTEEDKKTVKERIAKAFNTGESELEVSFLTKSGNKIPFYFKGQAIQYDGKKCMFSIGIDITERKRVEAEIKKNELLFQAMVENSESIIVLTDKNFKAFYRSPSTKKITGWTNEESDEIGSYELTHPDDREKVKKFMESVLKNPGKLSPLSIRGKNKNGGYVELEGTAINLLNDNNIKAIVTNLHDVTERKMIEEKIIKSEAKYRRVVENIHESLIIEDNDGKLIYANSEFTKIFGFTPEEFNNLSLKDYTSKESYNEIAERHNNRINGIPVDEEFVYKGLRKDGKEIWIEARVSSLYENGKIVGTQSLERDITARKLAEEKLKKSEERYRSLIEQASDAIMLTDYNGNFIDVNESLCLMFGYTKAELVGMNISSLIEPEQLIIRPIAFEKLKEGFHVFNERRMMHKNGTIINVEANVKGVNDNMVLAIARDITDRKIAEEKINKLHDSYITLMNNVDGIVWEADAKTFEFSFVSKQAERLLGYPTEQWINEPTFWADHIYKDDRNWAVDYCVKCTLEKIPHEFEYRMVALDGRIIWLRDIVSVEVENDKPVKLRGIMVDITERKAAEEIIKKSEEKYRSLIEQASDAINITDLKGNFIDVNESMCNMVGYTRMELIGKNATDLIDSEELRTKPFQLEREVKGEQVFTERKFISKKGTAIEVEANVKKINDNMLLAIVRDITERKIAERKIIENENKLQTIIRTEPECIKLLNQKGELLSMNPAGLAMIEADNEQQVVGRKIDEVVNPEYKKAFNELNQNVFKGNSGKLEFEITGLKGTHRWLETHAVPMKDADGNIISLLGVTRDITDKKEAEKEILQMNNQLRNLTEHLQTIREEERINMAHEIHDELGQQLTIVKMNLFSLLKKVKNVSPEFNEQAELVGESINKTVNTVRKIASNLRPVILDEQGLDDAMRLHCNEFSIQTGIQCNLTIEPHELIDDLRINTQIFRIFQESLTNVARHAGASKVDATIKTENGTLKLFISDNGSGFNPKTDKGKKSLGLVMMRERATSIGATLQIISEPYQGTSILLSVPIKPIV